MPGVLPLVEASLGLGMILSGIATNRLRVCALVFSRFLRWVARKRLEFISPLVLGTLIFVGLFDTATATPPTGFVTESIFRPDSAAWNEVVGMQFSDAGRLFVWERDGRVWIVDPDSPVLQPFLEISDEVGSWGDFGMLGFTLHPNFRNNGYVYLMYVVDRHHLMHCQEDPSGVGQAICDGTYNPLVDENLNATIGRITRYIAIKPQGDPDFSNSVTVDYNSRAVLLGETISTGCPILHTSHGTGSILFGHDGTLMASCGDGASFSSTDIGSASESYYQTGLNDGIISVKENIGAYRSQLLDSLSGKMMRINAMTGDGLASNPYFDSLNPRSARSRVWALGLRNAFRFTMKPDSGGVIPDPSAGTPGVFYIGDVGWTTWEELNILRAGGENFGWPAFEGMTAHSSYWNSNVENKDSPNPLFGINGCVSFPRR